MPIGLRINKLGLSSLKKDWTAKKICHWLTMKIKERLLYFYYIYVLHYNLCLYLPTNCFSVVSELAYT